MITAKYLKRTEGQNNLINVENTCSKDVYLKVRCYERGCSRDTRNWEKQRNAMHTLGFVFNYYALFFVNINILIFL